MKGIIACPRKRRSLRTVALILLVVLSLSVTLKMRSVHSLFFLEMKDSIPSKIETWENMMHIIKTQPLAKSGIIPNSSFSVWEQELTSVNRLQDLYLSGNCSTSQVYLLNTKNTSNTITIEEGQSVSLRIDVYNGYSKQQTSGGDEVRVWMVETESKKTAVCSVNDLKNGSYLANFKALFPGILEVHASLVYPKEYLRLVMALIHQGVIRYVAGLFEQSNFKEVTLCAPFPQLPNYTRVCDLSHENNNMSWYCGHPYNKALTCSDWTSFRPLSFPSHLPITRAENQLIKYISLTPYVKLIPTNLRINVTRKVIQSLGLPLCSLRSRPFLQSWKEKSPRGWFESFKWQPRTCSLYDLTVDRLHLCLNDTTIQLLGDSNHRQIYSVLRNWTQCKENVLKDWSQSLVCSRPDWNFKVVSIPHEHPLYLQEQQWNDKTMQSIPAVLNRISSTGKHIVFLHHYLHLSQFHHSIFRDRVSKTRDAVTHLLRRNPKAFVAIRGPHIANKGWGGHVFGGDNFAHHFQDIIKEEYLQLQSDTLFVDGWDMSVAIENLNFDLPNFVQHETARLLLAYACDFFLTPQ